MNEKDVIQLLQVYNDLMMNYIKNKQFNFNNAEEELLNTLADVIDMFQKD